MKSKCGDPRKLTFSQAQGYGEIPQRLKLGELPDSARAKIWDVFFLSMESDVEKTRTRTDIPPYIRMLGASGIWEYQKWHRILRDRHQILNNLPLDQWRELEYEDARRKLRHFIMAYPFNEIFDHIQFILRHPDCPDGLVDEMQEAFEKGMVAYVINDDGPPTIFPASTPEEGQSLTKALRTLQQGELSTAEDFLREASMDINRGDWAGSIKNSVDAAESVARTLVPRVHTFGAALNELKKSPALWPPQLVRAMENIWTYTNQSGIRHGSPEPTDQNVGQEEALFMLGTCASIASYLWRKHRTSEES